jgi:H+/gluconate symporter-like permease
MAVLLFPLQGAVLIITLAITVLAVAALIGVLTQPAPGFVAAEKQTKLFWIMVLVLGAFVPIIGVIAAIVYFVDVRPAVRLAGGGTARGGGSSSDGPYGPSRR